MPSICFLLIKDFFFLGDVWGLLGHGLILFPGYTENLCFTTSDDICEPFYELFHCVRANVFPNVLLFLKEIIRGFSEHTIIMFSSSCEISLIVLVHHVGNHQNPQIGVHHLQQFPDLQKIVSGIQTHAGVTTYHHNCFKISKHSVGKLLNFTRNLWLMRCLKFK